MKTSKFALERLRLRIKELSYSSHLNRKAKKIASNKGYFQKAHLFAREDSRHHILAYGFLTGKPYRVLEGRTRTLPNFDRVRQLIVEYERTAGYHHYRLKPEWEEAFVAWIQESSYTANQ